MSDDLRNLFTDNEEDPMVIDMPALHQRASEFQLDIRRRNFLEVFAAGMVFALFGRSAVTADNLLFALGPLSIAIGAVFIAWKLSTRGEAPAVEPGSSTADYLDQHRASLLFQAQLLADVPRWYLAPIVPGMAWVYALRIHETWGSPESPMVLALAAVSALFVAWVARLNLRGAAKLRAEAAALPTVDEV